MNRPYSVSAPERREPCRPLRTGARSLVAVPEKNILSRNLRYDEEAREGAPNPGSRADGYHTSCGPAAHCHHVGRHMKDSSPTMRDSTARGKRKVEVWPLADGRNCYPRCVVEGSDYVHNTGGNINAE